MPLLLHFKDGNKNNFQNGNAQMSCYNCYFLNIGKVFNEKDIVSFFCAHHFLL